MKKTQSQNILSATLILAGLLFYMLSNLTLAQENKSACCGNGIGKDVVTMNDASGDSTKKMDMKHEMNKHSDMKMDKQKSDLTTSIVREGVIDLNAIDKNKDGKVFQDLMDWNVISDKPGKCPLCKMTLKEVTLKQAKENLTKNSFKVKKY